MSRPDLQSRFRTLCSVREEVEGPSPPRLVQAKALLLCALPCSQVPDRSVTRVAQIAPGSRLAVTFTSVDEEVPLPFGADRALLTWMQTQAYRDGFVSLRSLTGFFRAFNLHPSGSEYQRFRARLQRVASLAITIRLDTENESLRLRLHPLKCARTPKEFETTGQTLPSAQVLRRERFGFALDPDFWAYLRANPVPLPLPLMRRFHGRPKAWDLAAFVLYRSYVARTPSVVPWPDLMAQLGSRDTFPRRLKATLSAVLDEIRVVYPNLRTRFLPGFAGLEIQPWKPSSETGSRNGWKDRGTPGR